MYTAILAAGFTIFAALLLIVFSPKTEKGFTEFYITGQNGTAAGYPGQLQAGEEGTVKAVIINNEHQTATYRIEIRVDGVFLQSIKDISLEHSEKWENTVFFKADKPNGTAKVEFLLFKDSQDKTPYRQLNLWVKMYP